MRALDSYRLGVHAVAVIALLDSACAPLTPRPTRSAGSSTLPVDSFTKAQPATFRAESSGAVDPDARMVALQVIHLVMPEAAYLASINQLTEQLWTSTANAGAKLPPDAKVRLNAAVIDCVPYDEMIAWSADLYAARFTASELAELLAFYKGPTGRKLARAMPDLMGEVGKKMGPILASRLPAAMNRQGLAH